VPRVADCPVDLLIRPLDLEDDPAGALRDVGAPDVGDHVELLAHGMDDRLGDELLGKGQVDPTSGHQRAGPADGALLFHRVRSFGAFPVPGGIRSSSPCAALRGAATPPWTPPLSRVGTGCSGMTARSLSAPRRYPRSSIATVAKPMARNSSATLAERGRRRGSSSAPTSTLAASPPRSRTRSTEKPRETRSSSARSTRARAAAVTGTP